MATGLKTSLRAIVRGSALLGSVALPVVAWGACGSSGSRASSGGHRAVSPSASSGAAATVSLRDVAFNPGRVVVRAGESVVWRWADGDVPHNVDFGDVTSGDPKTRDTYRRVFPIRGSFHYRCDVHPGMQGTVDVT